ncbi:putative alpha-ketoglutarate-dependent 2,4-dichlorophenoxyacetate dioxygenase [Xylariomycetidae sp. FL2044]|nr:putative alpha-ketoglutarate-dependent 2,4-dichlorophenoxyacetate dioxygenase [Xylariomycetidae sp. FL2044]
MEPYVVNGLTVTPIHPNSFGAEVGGVDWTQSPLPKDTIQSLINLQNKYAVIIFRATGLDNERQVGFAAQLGDLEVNPAWGGTERVGNRHLFDVSNIEADGSIVMKGSRRWAHSLGNALWHTDSSFNQHRAKYSMLLAHAVPGRGEGNTSFADTRQAWKDLSEGEKAKLRDLVVEHDLWHSRRLASPDIYHEPTAEELSAKPPSFHNLVQAAPNGGETLFLAAHAKTLYTQEGKALGESQEIIWDLLRHCTQPQYTFSAEWHSAGDMMWWDNRQSVHRASPYHENMGVRDVRRATVFDDGPGAFGVAKPIAASTAQAVPSAASLIKQPGPAVQVAVAST